jgi:hypothetical protein
VRLDGRERGDHEQTQSEAKGASHGSGPFQMGFQRTRRLSGMCGCLTQYSERWPRQPHLEKSDRSQRMGNDARTFRT